MADGLSPADEAARRKRVRQTAWTLALVVLGFYVAFIVMQLIRSQGGTP